MGEPMEFVYKEASMAEIAMLTDIRIEVLKAANQLPDNTDMSAVRKETYQYYKNTLEQNQHCAYLVFCDGQWVGAGGVSFFQVMPTYHNPSGKKAYIMNMYTKPAYRRQGIAYAMLDRLIKSARDKGVGCISLEATAMGKSLYLRYGFRPMEHELELPWPE